MVEDKDKGTKTPSDKEIKTQQSLIETVERLVAEKQGIHILSGQKGATSKPVSEDADVAEQLRYAEKKLQEHVKRKAKLKILPSDGLPTKEASNEEPHPEDEKVRLDSLKALLAKSDIAYALLQGHEGKEPKLIQDKQIYNVVFVKEDNFIAFNPQMTLGEAVCGVVRELRRAWLASDGDILYPLAYEPEDAILMNRILEADANTIAVWVAWELKLQGHNEAWSYLLSSNESLMAKSFAATARQDFRRLNSGLAAKAAFDAWFKSGLERYYDRMIIQEMLADELGYVFSSERTPIAVTGSLIDFIGEVPGDRNYMRSATEKPLPDTEFAKVNDRSNANFLWFVKFERSFQETEKELVSHEKEQAEKTRKDEAVLKAKSTARKDGKVIDLSGHFVQEQQEKNVDFVATQSLPETEALPTNVVLLFNHKSQ